MTPRIVLTVVGLFVLLHGALIYLMAADFAILGLPEMKGNNLLATIAMHEAVGFFSFFLGAVLLAARNLEISAAKSVLKGASIGLCILCAGATSHVFSLQDIPEQQPPLPIVVIFALLAVWSSYVSLKKDGST